jgi:hypothetical protein
MWDILILICWAEKALLFILEMLDGGFIIIAYMAYVFTCYPTRLSVTAPISICIGFVFVTDIIPNKFVPDTIQVRFRE